jgi:mRNA interferase HicA
MKRKALLAHLRQHGCELLREGGRHSWWFNSLNNKRSSVPRHAELVDPLAVKICKDLGIPSFKSTGAGAKAKK